VPTRPDSLELLLGESGKKGKNSTGDSGSDGDFRLRYPWAVGPSWSPIQEGGPGAGFGEGSFQLKGIHCLWPCVDSLSNCRTKNHNRKGGEKPVEVTEVSTKWKVGSFRQSGHGEPRSSHEGAVTP